MVTDEVILGRVVGEGQVATWTLEHVAAVATEDKGCAAATVEEEDYLLVCGERYLDSAVQGAAEDALVPGLELSTHIHHLDGWQFRVDGFL